MKERVSSTPTLETDLIPALASEPTAIRELTEAELEHVAGGYFSSIFFGGVNYPGGGGYTQVY